MADLYIQTPFEIGAVRFSSIDVPTIASWISLDAKGSLDDEQHKIRLDYRQSLEKDLRGLAAGVVDVEAEEAAALEVALEQVSEALALLRLYSSASFSPHIRSYCLPKGQESIGRYRAFFESVSPGIRESRGLLDDNRRPWTLRSEDISAMMNSGLSRLGKLLTGATPSEFQSRILTSLNLYSESTLEGRATTRLILILAALEGLLLKDGNEPIAQNLGERMAILTKDEPTQRVQATHLIKKIYALRSRFVHHSEQLEVNDELSQFYVLAWESLMAVAEHLDSFHTTREFLDQIDLLKMSGGSLTKPK